MLDQITMDVNWLAVIVGAVAAYILGALWYSPKMFGNKWMEGVGMSKKDKKKPMTHAMIAQGVGTFLLAWVIGVTETTSNLVYAILIALTISVIVKSNGLWAGKSKYAIVTESGYILAMVVVMILAHAAL